MIRQKGKDTEESLREWSKEQVKSASARSYDLGKFIFGVSIASIGVIVSIKKMSNESFDLYLLVSLILFLISIFIPIYMITPRLRKVGGSTNLLLAYISQIKMSYRLFWIWFVIWLAGLITGLLSILWKIV